MGKNRNAYEILIRNPEENRPFGYFVQMGE
jgi:hypothetical protein